MQSLSEHDALWRARDARSDLRFDFEDGSLVFNPSSWGTHYLNEAAALVLRGLMTGPRSAKVLAADPSLSHRGVSGEQVLEALEHMAVLGITEKV